MNKKRSNLLDDTLTPLFPFLFCFCYPFFSPTPPHSHMSNDHGVRKSGYKAR